MRHYLCIEGKNVTVDAGCNNPNIEDNTCPTGFGDCFNCAHFGVEITGEGAGKIFKYMKKREG